MSRRGDVYESRVFKDKPQKPRRRKANFTCRDCLCNTSEIHEYYMVANEVWRAAMKTGSQRRSLLCIGCLEDRLGRTLTLADFPDLPINEIFRQSDRLMRRMTGG